MTKRTFKLLAIIGVVIITILSFTVPSDPKEILPALTPFTFNKPVWLCGVVGGNFLYLIVLYAIYDKIKIHSEKKKSKIDYINYVNIESKKKNITPTRELTFDNAFFFNGKNISIGKIMIDDNHSKIFISTTYNNDGVISKPDIRCVSMKRLSYCKILCDNKEISINDIDKLSKKELKDVELEIDANVKDYFPFSIGYKMFGSKTALINVYDTLNEIIDQNKKK